MSDVPTTARDTEDRLAILDIEGEYALRCDAADGAGWAALFTADGVYQWPTIPGMPEAAPPLRGSAALAAACSAMPGTCMHRVSTPKVTISGDEATTRAHLVFEWAHVDEHGVSHKRELVPINHTEYLRTADGWKIRHRVTIPYSITDSSQCGYLHDIEIPERY